MNGRQKGDTSHPMPFFMTLIDGKTGATGVTPTLQISKNGGSLGSPVGSVSQIGGGWFSFAQASGDVDTLGDLILHATATNCDPADAKYVVVGYDPFDGNQLGLGVNKGATFFTVSNDSAPTTSSFTVNTTGSPAIKDINHYYSTPKPQYIVFTTGANIGKSVLMDINGHTISGLVSTFTFTGDTLLAAPSVGDQGFIIAGG